MRRYKFSAIAILPLFALGSHRLIAQQHPAEMTLLVGGDVQWSLTLRPPTVLYSLPNPDDIAWGPVPYLDRGESKATLMALPNHPTKPQHEDYAIRYHLQFSSDEEMLNYPFKNLAPTLRAADLTFVNLETPLSDHARMDGEARTPEKFAFAMRNAGIGLVTIANNHTFDTEIDGFEDTLRSLRAADLPFIGGGNDLQQARQPVIFVRHGIRIGFLGYSMFSNMGEPAFANDGRPGIAPMDPIIMRDDIRKLRPQVDFVVVSVHWSTDKSGNVSPANRKFAHELINDGADIILGAHPPAPKGIELYHGKVILYSSSHMIIGHNHPDWGDSYLARLTLNAKSVEKIEILPIACTGQELAQPFLLQGARAQALLATVQERTAALDTKMTVMGDKGIITNTSPSIP